MQFFFYSFIDIGYSGIVYDNNAKKIKKITENDE